MQRLPRLWSLLASLLTWFSDCNFDCVRAGASRYNDRLYFSAVLHMLAAKAFGSVLPSEITFTPKNEAEYANVTTNPLDDCVNEDEGNDLE